MKSPLNFLQPIRPWHTRDNDTEKDCFFLAQKFLKSLIEIKNISETVKLY